MAKSPILEFLSAQTVQGEAPHGDIQEPVPKIHVDEIASKVTAFYERVRNVIDYREEHLFRKHFIARALKRRLVMGGDTVAEMVVKDVIRAGHLPNDAVPETMIGRVDRHIRHLMCVRRELRSISPARAKELSDWFLRITTGAIEEELFPPSRDMALAGAMLLVLRSHLVVHGKDLKEEEIRLGLFVATQRALLRVDDDQLRTRLFRFVHPEWQSLSPDECGPLAEALPHLRRTIEHALRAPLNPLFLKTAKRLAPVFLVLGDVLRQAKEPEEQVMILAHADTLEEKARLAYRSRLGRERARLRRFAFFTVISLFLSKALIALALEIPIQVYFTHTFSPFYTLINVLFPPALMILIMAGLGLPSGKNRELLVREMHRVVSDEDGAEYVLTIPKRRSLVFEIAVQFFYIAMFGVSLYVIYRMLSALGFSLADIVVFAFFTSLVAAAGARIRNRATELRVTEKKPGFFVFIIDVFTLPFIAIGDWTLNRLSKMNIFLVLTDLLIDVPFHIFVEFIENLSDFVRGKKESIR